MTKNYVFITIFLGLFSTLALICAENTQSSQTAKIAIRGGIGACLGGLSYCTSKAYYSGIHFQKEDLPLFGLSCGAGLCVGIAVGLIDLSQNRHGKFAYDELKISTLENSTKTSDRHNKPTISEPLINQTIRE